MKKLIIIMLLFVGNISLFAQKSVSGVVFDEYLEPFPGATIKAGSKTTTSNINGEFTLKIKRSLPLTVQVSAIGYSTEEIELTSFDQGLNFILKETSILDQVVVSASRTPERILESPVTVERYGMSDVKKNASSSFYDGLENLKGVDINTSSLGFKSINTRGFAGFENARFVQLIDGIDNMVPSLNYAMGNMAGVSDIDIESVEILPGAASALYGANAFNGVMLMKTKSPFDHQGITVQFKSGITKQEMAGNNPFYDTSIRMAYAFNDKLAAKATLSYFKGEEWHAGDKRSIENNKIVDGVDKNSYGYDGINVYGDEINRIFPDLALLNDDFNNLMYEISEQNPTLYRSLTKEYITRTGYEEKYLTEYKAKKLNFNMGLHYRPLGNDKLELIWNSRFNQWDNLYQGQYRYAQKDFYMHQHKLEVKGHDFFARAYYSQNKTGNSYNLQKAAENINRAWSSDDNWFGNYATGIYANTDLTRITDPGIASMMMEWNRLAREEADKGRLSFESNTFKTLFNKVISDSNQETGAKQHDETRILHGDIQFNLKNYIKWVEIIVGSSYRFYKLNSFGTIFTDKENPIKYDEYGTYLQVQKSIFDKRLRLTGSIRYDKSTNYDGNYSPRAAINYVAGKNRGHNFRFSYQTAFRNPTAQEQYMGLTTTPRNHVVGTARDNLLERYQVNFVNSFYEGVITGKDILNQGITASSALEFINQEKEISEIPKYASQYLKKVQYDYVKPEKVQSFEFGYRSLLKLTKGNLLEIDFSAYYNTYKNLITEKEVYVIHSREGEEEGIKESLVNSGLTDEEAEEFLLGYLYGSRLYFSDYDVFRVKTNSQTEVKSWGAAIGLKTKMFKNFDIGGSYSYADFEYDENEDPDFTPNFNTSKHKVKLQFGNKSLFKNFGFNIQGRWQDKYYWQSPFVSGEIPARTMLDAQLNYRVPSLKSTFKLGGTNLTGKEYFSAPGTGAVGSTYYLTWTIND